MRPVRTISMIDIDAAGGIDPARLARALKLSVRRIERGRYELTGGKVVHYVDLIDPAMDRCDCPDFAWRQVVCQHLLACLLREGDERVLRALARLVLNLREHNRQLRASVSGRTIPLTLSLKARVAAAARAHVDDLDFRRDRTQSTSDLAVHLRATGELVGHVTRSSSRPAFIPSPALHRPSARLKVAA
jgi:hypothetical protein